MDKPERLVNRGERIQTQPQLNVPQPPQIQVNYDEAIADLANKIALLTSENAILKVQLRAVSQQLQFNETKKDAK
jgi:hypothetical protein